MKNKKIKIDLFAGSKSTAARIAEVRFSRKENLVLTVTPAVSAKNILTPHWTTATICRLRDCLPIHPADHVIIHNIPLRHVQGGQEGSWLDQNLHATSDADEHLT